MSTTHYICTTCGVQYASSNTHPANCKICEDDRQYVNPAGQSWTTLGALQQQHKNKIEQVAPNLYAIYTEPAFGIGQRAHLLVSPGGNILWDCISLVDTETIEAISALGGVQAMAISHPHYFSSIVVWGRVFGNVPVYINAFDEKWLARKDANIKLWSNAELNLWDGIQLICCGGHFPGATVLFSPQNNGILLVGDTIQVNPDRKTVSFMYSYPNLIPLPKKAVLGIREAVIDKPFDAMYGAFGHYILKEAKAAMAFSAERYLKIFE